MNLKKMFLDRYLSDEMILKGFYLRIRKEKGNKENIKVYYEGFKIFDLFIDKRNNEELFANAQLFIPNSKNVYKDDVFEIDYMDIPSSVIRDTSVIEEYFDMEIGSGNRGGGDRYVKLDFLFALGAKNIDVLELRNLVDERINVDIKKEVKLIKTRTGSYKISLVLKGKKISFRELYDLKLKLLDQVIYKLGSYSEDGFKRYFRNVNLNLKFKLNKDISVDDLIRIENVLVYRTIIYAGLEGKKLGELDYKNTKSPNNQEKQKQQKFMVMLNNIREDVMYKSKDGKDLLLYSRDVKPFELEYVIYTGAYKDDDYDVEDSEVQKQENIKGRIDNTLFVDDEALFVEIKYGNEVIAGSNGIHKHLIDLYSCLNMNKDEILKYYGYRINDRNEIILGRKLDASEKVKVNKIRYDIVCIYNNKDKGNENTLSYNAVKNRIDEIYIKNCYDSMKIGNKEDKIKMCAGHNDMMICKDMNNYCRNLLSKNVPELMEMIYELGCEVKILLVDDEFMLFEEYK